MKRGVHALAAVVIVALAAIPALAKGPPSKVTITGPGLQNVEITDPALLANFDLVALIDWQQPAPSISTELTDGYKILFWYQDGQGKFWSPFQVDYFPSLTDKPSTIFNSSATDGPWYYAKPQGDAAMKHILAQHGVSLLPATGESSHQYWWLLTLGGSLLVVGGMAGAAARRRALST